MVTIKMAAGPARLSGVLQEDRTAAKTADRDLVVSQALGASQVSTLHMERGEERSVLFQSILGLPGDKISY